MHVIEIVMTFYERGRVADAFLRGERFTTHRAIAPAQATPAWTFASPTEMANGGRPARRLPSQTGRSQAITLIRAPVDSDQLHGVPG
jgi:hypothetical protein